MTIKAILFDKDGTLLDFNGTFAPATVNVLQELARGDTVLAQRMAEAVDFDLEKATISPGSILIAGSLENISKVLLPIVGQINFSTFNAQVDALYVKHTQESLVGFDFLVPTLDTLAAMSLPIGIATNDSEAGAHAHLDKLNVKDRFCFIAGYDSGHGEKPGPGMVIAFAKHLGLDPSEIAMVGDSTHDCHAGKAAGAMAIGVASGGASEADLKPHADYVLNDISELSKLIDNLNQ